MVFSECIEIVLKYEGGYNVDSHDPGGETNFGISKRQYPDLDIKRLKRADAIEIYRRDYWHKYKLGDFPEFFRLAYFDTCVNCGGPTAAKMLQRLLGVTEDGIVGPSTFKAMRSYEPKDLVKEFILARLNIYARQTEWSRFGAGWAKRLIEISLENIF